jgi:hypothetical protein
MARVLVPGSLSGLAKRLTRVSAGDEIHVFKSAWINVSDICILANIRPAASENLPAVIIDFDLPVAFHPGSV